MATRVPIVRQISWISLIPQLLFLGLIIFIYYKLNLREPIFFGALTFLVMPFFLRKLFSKDYRRGMKLVKKELFSEAIPFFEKSVEYYIKNKWVDKYRYLTLLSSSKMSYKEMGLCNIAFCYSQTGDVLKAKEYYEQIINEFPNNGIALTGLRFINAVNKNKEDKAN